MQRWLWVTLPDVYEDHPFDFDIGDTWSCNESTRPRDLALLYRAELAQDFSHVWRVDSDPYEHAEIRANFGTMACDCTLVATLKRPVTLSRIRQDPS